jgi:MFS family permease
MFAIVSSYWLFVAAVVVITIGEMIVMPTSQTLAAHFARIDMRGRYMAVFDLTNKIPATVGPAAAGLILDHYDPNLLWHLGGVLCAISAVCFYALHLRLGAEQRFAPAITQAEAVHMAIEA